MSPADGSIFRGPATITLVADARDRDGRVVSVEFFNREESLGLVHRPSLELRPLDDGGMLPVLPPFVFTWENVPAGGYVLSAVATDNDGAFTHSAPVEVKVVATQRPPVVTIHTIDGTAREQSPFIDIPPDLALLQVQREGSVEHALKVFYRVGGTAENGVDYVELPGVVEIPAGAKHADLVIEPIDDDLVEGDESVIVKLLPPDARMLTNIRPPHWPRYVVGEPAMARAVIRDDDEPPPGNQPPRVALLAPLDGSVFRAGADIGLAAAAGDPDGWVQQVEFFANDESLGVVPGTNLGTTAREWFRLKWAAVPPGGYELVAVATDNEGASTRSAPIRIRVLDVCARTYVSIAAIDPIASEGPRLDAPLAPALVRPDTATIRISRRAGDVSLPLEVRYAIGGTAANSEDYRELSGVAVIPANAWHVDVVIWPIYDELVEGTETVILGLLEPPCPAIEPPPSGCYVIHGSAKAIAYILDNDTADNQLPKLALTQPATGDTLPLPEPVTIVAHTVDPDGWVSKVEFFANGEKIGEEEIVFIQEPPPGQEQRFSLRWTGAPAGKYVLVARATDNRGGQSRSEAVRIAIVDEHPIPKVYVVAVDPVGAEGTPPKTATFAIHRTARNDVPLEVFYQLGGTAENGVDYEHLGGSVIIPAGEWRAPVVVVPIDDDLVEGTETVILELLTVACPAIWPPSPDCYEVSQPGRAIAFIRDNDIQHNRPPRIALTEPVDGDVFTGPLDIKLRAVARDPDGWVSRVIFYDGREPIGEVALDFIQPPPPGERQVFEFLWQDAPVGRHGLTAVAVDDQGARAVSDPVFIQVIPPQGPPVVTIHARDPFARETKPDAPPQTATFRIHRTGPTGTPLTVFYRVGGTATNGEDYEELSGVLIIPAGRASAPIVVRPIDDDLPKRVETVLLALVESPQLVTTPSYVIGRPARAAAFILDNDRPRPASVELPDGLVHLRLAARDGVSYALEATENFQDWWPVDHRTAREGVVEFIDPDAPGKVMRFYRLVESVDPLRLEDDLD